MTSLDILLIVVGLLVIILSATQGLIRVLMMFFSFYVICVAAGMMTLAANTVQKLATTIAIAFEMSAPSLSMAQLIVFLIVLPPLFIASYFITKAAFGDTSLPKLKGLDNVLGALVGMILALVMMAVICNTWGVAVNAPRDPTQFWNSMRTAYYYSALRPLMMQIMEAYKLALFVFHFLEYPPFFIPQW